MGRKLEAKVGLDEQKSDIRPVAWGNPAMDGDAQLSSGHAEGRSGEARGEDSRLNQGGLSFCLDDPDYRHGNMTGWTGRSQQRP